MVQVNNQNNLDNITEDEATLYDRQIRLWGLDAQKRYVSTGFISITYNLITAWSLIEP